MHSMERHGSKEPNIESFPLGAIWLEDQQAYSFTLYSKRAESILLLLYEEDDVFHPVLAHPFDPRTEKSGSLWHCIVPRDLIGKARYYAYQVSGPSGYAFDPEKILFDPFAKVLFFPPTFDRRAAMRPGSNVGKAPLGVLCPPRGRSEDNVKQRPKHQVDTIIYELHVKGFTMNPNSGVSKKKRGTYEGLIEKIPYLLELGITVVELMPVFQFDPQEGNFWGYMPLDRKSTRLNSSHRL